MSETAQFEVPVSTMAQGNAGLGCSQCTFGKDLVSGPSSLLLDRAKTLSNFSTWKGRCCSVYIRSSLVLDQAL